MCVLVLEGRSHRISRHALHQSAAVISWCGIPKVEWERAWATAIQRVLSEPKFKLEFPFPLPLDKTVSLVDRRCHAFLRRCHVVLLHLAATAMQCPILSPFMGKEVFIASGLIYLARKDGWERQLGNMCTLFGGM